MPWRSSEHIKTKSQLMGTFKTCKKSAICSARQQFLQRQNALLGSHLKINVPRLRTRWQLFIRKPSESISRMVCRSTSSWLGLRFGNDLPSDPYFAPLVRLNADLIHLGCSFNFTDAVGIICFFVVRLDPVVWTFLLFLCRWLAYSSMYFLITKKNTFEWVGLSGLEETTPGQIFRRQRTTYIYCSALNFC